MLTGLFLNATGDFSNPDVVIKCATYFSNNGDNTILCLKQCEHGYQFVQDATTLFFLPTLDQEHRVRNELFPPYPHARISDNNERQIKPLMDQIAILMRVYELHPHTAFHSYR